MNLVFNASAGTGKTYQVVRLYGELVLQEGIDPREILLMTFTENAAAELRMRVAHRIIKARRQAEAAGDDVTAERAILASSRLAGAPIGTIHSFCTRLLREHALEAGLSPGFSVLEGDEREELLNRICREELLDHVATDPDFQAFCAGAHVIGSGNGFGSSIIDTVPTLIAQAGSFGVSLEDAETLLPDPEPRVDAEEFRTLLHALQAIGNPSRKVVEATLLLEECIEAGGTACGIADRFDRRFSGHFAYGDARDIYHEFKVLKEEARARQRYLERRPAAQAFARYVQSVARRFQQSKHSMNAVDFDDQLRLAARLLASGSSRPAFRCVIVDEVQDTSRIQCDIIQSLWKGTGCGETEKGGPPVETHLVICGDRKQSIYTWRGADPQVMPDLEQAILAAGGAREHLRTSYRSKAPILDVVNRLFDSVYGPGGYPEEEQLVPNPEFAADETKPCVEFLAPGADEENLSRSEQVTAEMTAVARRIRLLVEGPGEWRPRSRHDGRGFHPTDASANAYRYADVLILLRRTAHLPVLEQALRHAGIPYTLGGKGRGLFSRQETRDISLFLNVLTNPSDTWSLIGFLRSPWIGLSDTAIAELAWHNGTFSIDHLTARYAEQTDLIDRYRARLGSCLASELVRSLIRETGYDALLAGLPRGTQRLANLRKVIDWLRDAERGVHTTPASVARRLANLITHPPQIPEAALLDPARNAVTIMTVHGAKGLTRNVVFVPDLAFAGNSDRGFAQVYFEDTEPRLGVRITAPDRSAVKSPGLEDAARRAADVRNHESMNLFYVAMTRARDLVVTSATVGKRSAGSWYSWMEPLIGSAVPPISYAAIDAASPPPPDTTPTPPTAERLAAALGALPPAPAAPTLRRIPATRLAREEDRLELEPEDPDLPGRPAGTTAAALGSLGHAVLEQLALNSWQGAAEYWLETLRDEFGIDRKAAESVLPGIEEARGRMAALTAEATEIRPEFPFVMLHENQLVDGTIDLLCRTPLGGAVFDYKFTEMEDAAVTEHYRAQMELYRRAAEKCFPGTVRAEVHLVVISSRGTRVIRCP